MNGRERIFRHVEKEYGTRPDYPFHKFPDYAALRHGEGGSWYGLVMNVPRKRLGLQGAGEVDILDLKNTPEKISLLQGRDGFLPAYHMNKEHWITIILDGRVSSELIASLIDESHALTK